VRNKDVPPSHWSRRVLLASAAALPAVMLVPMVEADAQAQKLAQKVVQYQETPKDGHECDGCVNFIAPASCKLVAGVINPKGWCVAFAPKSS
jgi:hypothetical protein